MSVRKATPEETQAFWGKPAVVFGQKKPESQKASQTPDSTDEELSDSSRQEEEAVRRVSAMLLRQLQESSPSEKE
jgi:hypothetical protein